MRDCSFWGLRGEGWDFGWLSWGSLLKEVLLLEGFWWLLHALLPSLYQGKGVVIAYIGSPPSAPSIRELEKEAGNPAGAMKYR